jgi:hypothetical protein
MHNLAAGILAIFITMVAYILFEPFVPVLRALARREKPRYYDVQVAGMCLTVIGCPGALIGLGAGLLYASVPALMVGLGAAVLFIWGLVITWGRR